jgi:hypothetical protein
MNHFPPERRRLDLPWKASSIHSEEASFGRGPLFSTDPTLNPEALS